MILFVALVRSCSWSILSGLFILEKVLVCLFKSVRDRLGCKERGRRRPLRARGMNRYYRASGEKRRERAARASSERQQEG